MRIAQLAPLVDAVAPDGAAPLQRLIHYLVEELTDRGHEVTLFAGMESQTRAITPCLAVHHTGQSPADALCVQSPAV